MTSERVLRPVALEGGAVAHMAADRRLAAEHWLLAAHHTPRQARAEWARHNVALLPCGTLFSAVRIPGRLVQAVAASTDPADIDLVLAEVLDGGPVICDPHGPRYYALVPGGMPRTWRAAADDWRVADVDVLGRGTYLGVPRLDAVDFAAAGTASYWSVPMESAGVLCAPLAVARLIAAGVHQLAEDRAAWPVDPPLTPVPGVVAGRGERLP
ncbi:hypothetical protein [Streptomyces ardesiacus]|uniref:hypothetical protein n=1 Tax=Streptomyces ardesiacus TaxID=285564 RepID=UPI002FDC2FFE